MNKRKNQERDEQLARLRAEGLSFTQIGRRMGISASAVGGALDRWDRRKPGGKPKREKSDVTEEQAMHARTINKAKRAKGKPLPHQKMTFAQGVRRPPTILPSARTQAEREQMAPTTHAMIALPKYAAKKAPADAVPFQQRKANGCTWTYGGDGEPYLQCNRPRCKVARPSGVVYDVPYCADHWEARRATKHTKIIPHPVRDDFAEIFDT